MWRKLIPPTISGLLTPFLIDARTIAGQDQPSKAKVVIVTSFESPQELQPLALTNARVSLTKENVTDGTSALKVEFSGTGPASIEFPSGIQPWDWREYGAIAFDLTNPNAKAPSATGDVCERSRC